MNQRTRAIYKANEKFVEKYGNTLRNMHQNGGQNPKVTWVGCSDSRKPIERIVRMGPGQIFCIRVAGGMLDTSGLASLEYAVAKFNPEVIFMVGHTKCGAVGAGMELLRKVHEPGSEISLDAVSRSTPLGSMTVEICRNIAGDLRNLHDDVRASVTNLLAQANKALREIGGLRKIVADDPDRLHLSMYNTEIGKLVPVPVGIVIKEVGAVTSACVHFTEHEGDKFRVALRAGT